MSITKIAQLTCDLCGHSEQIDDGHNTAARVKALKRGWKFMVYQNLPTGRGSKVNGQAKQIDACPSCELPMPDEMVDKLADKQNT